MNWKKITGIVIVLAIILFLAFNIFGGSNKEENALHVSAAKVSTETIEKQLTTTGTLIPNDSQALYGQDLVQTVNVTVGDQVKKDQIVATYASGLTLKSSIDGTVTAVNIKANETDTNAQSGKASIEIADLSTLKVELSLSKSEASDIQKEQAAIITNDKTTFLGRVTEIDPIATTSQETTGSATSLKAIVSFTDEAKGLFAGFDVDVAITTATAENVTAIPIEALQYDKNNQAFVYTIQKGKAKKVKIEIGIQSDTKVQITKGLEKGSRVILSPDSSIKNGKAVTTK